MHVEGVKREFKLKAESAEERKSWVTEINAHIEEAKKFKSKDSDVTKESKFWKKCEKVTEDIFLK